MVLETGVARVLLTLLGEPEAKAEPARKWRIHGR
jgi:hypothetical protein